MKKIILAITALALGSLGFAQTPEAAGVPRPATAVAPRPAKPGAAQLVTDSPDSTTCAFTFTSNAAQGSINYCVTVNGNVMVLEIPKGLAMVSQADHGEGYGICDDTTNVAYRDFGGFGGSANWGIASVLSHDSKSVKIARTTADGLWTLTQTITRTTGPLPTVKISMGLTNNTDTFRHAILVRYADVDAAGIATNNLDATQNSAFAWNPVFPGDPSFSHGLALQNLGTTTFLAQAYVQSTAAPPDPCNPFVFSVPDLLENVDGSIVMFYEPGVRPHATVTMTAAYKGR